jgi:hypothetical protein
MSKRISGKNLSLSAKVEQLALFLRNTSHKHNPRKQKRLKGKAAKTSSSHTIQQIAKILRAEIHKIMEKKKAA